MHGLNLSTWWIYSLWQCFCPNLHVFLSYLECIFLFVQSTFHFLQLLYNLYLLICNLLNNKCFGEDLFLLQPVGVITFFDTRLMSWNDILSIKLLAADYSSSSLLFLSIFYYFTGLSLVCHQPRRALIHIILPTQPCLFIDRITLWPTNKKLKKQSF